MFDAVLVMVNRYIKFAKYIPPFKNWKAENIADVLVKKVFTKYNKLVFFVNNFSLLFISKFWLYLYFYLSIRLEYNIVFHPQTNVQTENQNQILK